MRANDDRVDDPGAADDDTAMLAFLVTLLLAVLLTLALALTLVVLREGAAEPTDPGDPEDHRDDVRQRALLDPLHCRSSPDCWSVSRTPESRAPPCSEGSHS